MLDSVLLPSCIMLFSCCGMFKYNFKDVKVQIALTAPTFVPRIHCNRLIAKRTLVVTNMLLRGIPAFLSKLEVPNDIPQHELRLVSDSVQKGVPLNQWACSVINTHPHGLFTQVSSDAHQLPVPYTLAQQRRPWTQTFLLHLSPELQRLVTWLDVTLTNASKVLLRDTEIFYHRWKTLELI